MEKTSVERPVIAENVKKATEAKKAKPKKKPKAKTLVLSKSKNIPSPAVEKEEEEPEKMTTSTTGNSAIINVLSDKVNNDALENNMSTEYCFLVDMSLRSVRMGFFI